MDICHPEIIRAERFGSRDCLDTSGGRCKFCTETIFEEQLICDITGNLFCSEKCRTKNLKDKRGVLEND